MDMEIDKELPETAVGTSNAIPTLAWPLATKKAKDVSLFFAKEDSVKGTGKTCDRGACGATTGTSEKHYPYHLGIDILGSVNASVTSVYSGTVVKIGSWNIYNGPQWGKYVLVEHTNGSSTWVTQYGHIEPKAGLVERSSSNPGSSVAAGGEIGKLITLDYTSTGDYPHLHFGIWNGSYNRLIAYDANAHRGITKDCSTTDYFKFVNPLPYLTQGYAIADDSLITNSSYKCSNVLDFYYGTGYRYLDKNLTNSITFPFTLSGAGYRKVYAKYLSASNLTTKARYTLTHSGQTTVTKDINQTTDLKGGWAYLGQIYYDPSKGQLNVKIQNCSPSVGELIIDALLVDK